MKDWMRNLLWIVLGIIAVIVFHEQIWHGIIYVLSFFISIIIDFCTIMFALAFAVYLICNS